MHFAIQIDEYFYIKCYFRVNLKTYVTKNIIFWGISLVESKPEIHSPGNFFCLAVMMQSSSIYGLLLNFMLI